jgi:hypothetical protein
VPRDGGTSAPKDPKDPKEVAERAAASAGPSRSLGRCLHGAADICGGGEYGECGANGGGEADGGRTLGGGGGGGGGSGDCPAE